MTAGSFCQRVSHFVPLLSQMPPFFLQLFSEHWVLWSFYILTFISLLFFFCLFTERVLFHDSHHDITTETVRTDADSSSCS